MVAVIAELQTDKCTNIDWHKKFKMSVVSSHIVPIHYMCTVCLYKKKWPSTLMTVSQKYPNQSNKRNRRCYKYCNIRKLFLL
jgi:hypothetical protein